MTWRYFLASLLLAACVGGESKLGTARDDIDSTDPSCALLTPAQLHDAAMRVYQTELSDPQSCFPGSDLDCPCGSYCSTDAACEVDCVPNPAPGEPTCGAGKACTPAGRCADAPNAPPPPLLLSINFAQPAVSTNTTTGPVLLPIEVTTSAISFDAMDDAETATVHFSIQGSSAPVTPLVKCTSTAAFTATCDLAGGWMLNVVDGAFRSQPRTIWVQVPQTATSLRWTLEARSANAIGTSTEVIDATPVVTPATDPGHYKGTLSYANSTPTSPAISIPVEAVVTPSTLAVLEPTKLLFADGHVVIPRTTQTAVQLGWLAAGGGRYDVQLAYTGTAYDPTTGHLDASLDVLDGTGAESTSLTLSLDRIGEVSDLACPCATGNYCNQQLNVCLPGTAPTDQVSVNPATSYPSSVLASADVAAWTGKVLAATFGSTALGGTGHALLQQAYCYNATFPTVAGALGANTTSPTSGDLECAFGPQAALAPQQTFPFEEYASDYAPGTGGGAAQDLIDACAADLAAQPSASTASGLMPTTACASLGRFYLALAAGRTSSGAGVPLPDIDQRLVMQILRQWLGVNAYVAHTSVQDRDADDALSATGLPAYQRFATMLARVDADLRVLLDPEVRPQYATGAGLPVALARPDYRVRPRPLARWSFSNASTPGADSEGHDPLVISGTSLVNGTLFAQSPGSSSRSTNAIAAGDHRFSVVFALDYKPPPGSTATVFWKVGTNGDRLSIDATPATTGDMNLRMYDSRGGSVTFSNVSSGLIAIAVDGTSYTLYSSPMGSPSAIATVNGTPVNGGPSWGAAGTINLNTNLQSYPASCTSWDLNNPNDGLDYTTDAPSVVHSASWRYTCKDTASSTTCTGTPLNAATCTTIASNLRTTDIAQIKALPVSPYSSPPSTPLNALSTHGTIFTIDEKSQTYPTYVLSWTDWRCDTTVSGYIRPVTRNKPVCGGMKASWDEVSLWDRPVQPSEFVDMATRYPATSDSLPPIATLAGSEQPTALPVHMLEAAAADLELLAAYAGAERSHAYGECYLGGHSAGLDALAASGGANLRLVGVLEGEADHLAAIGGGAAASWYPRYAAAKEQLAARRTLAVRALLEASRCENPIGISQHDIPLYVGEDVGPNATFFASSHYLADQAVSEITLADQLLNAARAAYTNQRQQAYQLAETSATKQERAADLRASAESQLAHYCGSTQSATSLLDAFQQGTTAQNNCFIDRLLPQCATFATATLESIPAECLRGELGNQMLAIKTAGIVMANADHAMKDAGQRYDGDLEHCAQEQKAFDGDERILQEHDQEMEKLHEEQALFDTVAGLAKSGLDFANPFGLTNPEARLHGTMDALGAIGGFSDSAFAITEQQVTDSYNEEVLQRSHDETIANCYHDADNERYLIDNARDQVVLAKQQFENATHQLAVDFDQLGAITSIALGQLATESTLSATPPHLHFWLDQSISDYHKHLEAARRLTYLALKALEYEAQVSLGLDSATLTAAVPSDLRTVVGDIQSVNAPLAGQLGVSTENKKIVLSLRDEILKMPPSTANVPGDLALTPVARFQRYLAANSTIYVDANGKRIGRGIRFTIHPDTWNSTLCDERMWRIQPSLQADTPPAQHTLVLYQDNTFGSQDCRAAPGNVISSHADPAGNLLLGDGFELPMLALPQPYVAANIDGPPGLDHETLSAQPESSTTTFAGRGLYGSYVLLFPEPLWTDADIANVKDVLLRFDITDVAHPPTI